MLASKDFADGHYQSTPQHGIRAFGRVYSAWAYGQTVSYLTMKDQDNTTFIVVPGVQVPDGRRVSHVAIYVHEPPSCNFANRYPDLNSWLRERWEGGYVNNWDANDMIALLNTWQKGDISIIRDGGDYEKALKSIKAKALIMPSKTDLYFPVSPPPSNCESTTDTVKAGGQRNGSVAPQRC